MESGSLRHPRGGLYFEAFSVGQMYHQFARTIRGDTGDHPTFDTAVDLHKLLDAIRRSSDEGRAVEVPGH